MLPTMVAAMAASMKGVEDARGSKEQEKIIEELSSDVRRLRRQRNEEENTSKRLREDREKLRETLDDLKNKSTYFELKTEFLRRVLVSRQRDRSPAGEKGEYRNMPQGQLLDAITKYEVDHNLTGWINGPTGETKKEKRREGENKSLAERLGTRMKVRTLAARINPPGPGTDNVPTEPLAAKLNIDIPATAVAVSNNLVPATDALGNRITPKTPVQGFRIVYGVVVDMSRPLPATAPTEESIHPLTWYAWTKQELDEYPYGIPGWVKEPNVTVGMELAPVKHYQRRRLQLLDKSYTMVGLPKITNRTDGPMWRYPYTEEEADHLRQVAHQPCNLIAYEFWGQYLNECATVPKNQRTALQGYVAQQKNPRPSWAPYRRNPYNPAKQERKLARRRERAEAASHTTTITEGDHHPPPAVQFGSIDSQEGARIMNNYGESPVTIRDNRSTTNPKPPKARGLWAGSEYTNEWISYLNINPDIEIPGILRDNDGLVASHSAVRGMLRVAQLGYEDESGQYTLQFIREVTRFITETSVHFRPSQLMNGLSITDIEDMTTEKIREHLKMIKDDMAEYPVMLEEDGVDQVGVMDWLAVVDPIPTAGRTADDEDEDMGVNPELMM